MLMSQEKETVAKRPIVTIYTDGSCIRKPTSKDDCEDNVTMNNGIGCGGWAYIVINRKPEYNSCTAGSAHNTTSARMELTAAYKAVESIKYSAIINLFSDSEYVVGGLKNLGRWDGNGWKTKNGEPVKNVDLWKKILSIMRERKIDVFSHWIKGHSGNAINEAADKIAQFHSQIAFYELRKELHSLAMRDLANSKSNSLTKRTPKNHYLGRPRRVGNKPQVSSRQ